VQSAVNAKINKNSFDIIFADQYFE